MNAKIPKKYHVCKKDFIWNHSTCACELDIYLKSIKVDSVIKCGEFIEPTKTVPISFNDKKQSVK